MNKSVIAAFCILLSGVAQSNTIVMSSGDGNSNISFSNGKVIVNGKSIPSDSNVVIVNDHVMPGDAITDDGQLKTEEREVPDYFGIKLDAPVELTYKVSNTKSLKITAAENILPLIASTVADGYLTIDLKEYVSLTQPIQIEASGQTIEAIKILSSGNAVFSGLDGQALAVTINGSGDAVVSGHVDRLSLAINGSGDIDASSLVSEDLDINMSGAGEIKAFSNRSVSGDISGAGSAVVKGNPSRRMVDVSGAGTVAYE